MIGVNKPMVLIRTMVLSLDCNSQGLRVTLSSVGPQGKGPVIFTKV